MPPVEDDAPALPVMVKASATSPDTPEPPWQAAATRYLDDRSAAWLADPPQVRNHFDCALSCHTTLPYTFVRPALGPSPILDDALARVRERVQTPGAWSSQTGWYGREGRSTWTRSLATEAVVNASALALAETAQGLAPSETTLLALDRMWEVQRPDGAWSWLDFGYQPWEAGNEAWGAAMGALAVGLAPADYQRTHTESIDALRGYLHSRLEGKGAPLTLHARVTIAWANRHLEGLLTPDQRQQIITDLHRAQRPDGGWSMADLLAPRRLRRTIRRSDGHATGLVAFVLCTEDDANLAASHGLQWLRDHQRDDGAWPAWSPNRDQALSHLHMRDAATAYAALALSSCDATAGAAQSSEAPPRSRTTMHGPQ